MSFHKRREKYKKKRNLKKKKHGYTFGDFISDLFFYFPEMIVFPFRVIWYGIRLIIRVFDWT